MRVIGVSGMPGSGKSIISDKCVEKGAIIVSMGDIIREEAKKRGIADAILVGDKDKIAQVAAKIGMNLDVAIQAIKDSEGIPVLAHPLSLYVSWGKIEGVLTDLKERGICGLEAWHSGVRLSEAKRLEELARKLGFFVTAGSDFHGEKVRADRKIGHTAGGLKIDSRFWQDELSVQLKNL